ncbi:hypothetical protein EH165_13810 [Nakamurella antarctica]|uniref:Lipoprotein LpqN n=1 Tax=Nakamurella antarctica TaxID=1902245 RepID=A0A3G8ZPJ1_9ACTN|nr:hypothetical protein [Nakamurella antarctica]AZI59058.1 hypothetical protein EH165_13810 [Nakamurella antarctica]
MKLAARSALIALVGIALAACSTTVPGKAGINNADLVAAAANKGEIPQMTDLPSTQTQIPAATDTPSNPETPELPTDIALPTGESGFPTDLSGLPTEELPANWPAEVALPDGAKVISGMVDPSMGLVTVFTVPATTPKDLAAYFEGNLTAAGYAPGQNFSYGGVYLGEFTKGTVTVTLTITPVEADSAGSISIAGL